MILSAIYLVYRFYPVFYSQITSSTSSSIRATIPLLGLDWMGEVMIFKQRQVSDFFSSKKMKFIKSERIMF